MLTGNILDLFPALFGLAVLIYGLWTIRRMRVSVGFRKINYEIKGRSAKRIGIIYAIFGAIMLTAALLSWLNVVTVRRGILTFVWAMAGIAVVAVNFAAFGAGPREE